jgi:two-component system, cell cycle response regulator DivK
MSRATILIVEDSPDISQALSDAFRFSDFAVLQAYSAVEALQFAAERQPDLILMDIQLPDLDGLSVAQTLKQDPATRQIPIVAMTAYDVVGTQARLIGQLCIAHCQKPFSPRDVINLATAILKLPGEPPSRPQRPSPTRPPIR